ncbi:MAG: DUF58 domain-containing protein [Planctomycetes bacterium]|nr:DUF58 domain-containing protein [Planctomycetota bacterium]
MTEQVLDARTRDLLRRLEIDSRNLVSGMRYGLHRSRRKGVSSDFLYHRGYNPGDPLKHLDWKVFARTERYYVKQYVEDSSMSLWCLVDGSSSMNNEGDEYNQGEQTIVLPTKFEIAARLAGAFCCLAINQQDRTGLTLSGDKPILLRPSSNPSHLTSILHTLAENRMGGGADIGEGLRIVTENASGNSLIVLFTDLSFPPETVRQRIKTARAKGHDMILVHIASPTESRFEFNRWVDFRCLEKSGLRHRLDATHLRRLYLEEYQSLMQEWGDFCKRQRVDFLAIGTDEELRSRLSSYLRQRLLDG